MRHQILLRSGFVIAALLSLGILPAQGAIASAYSGKGTHPGFTIAPMDALGKFSTMGLAWLRNGDMVWVRAPDQYINPPSANANAGVWIVKNVATSPVVTKLVDQFRQPTGVAVGANDEIMVVDLDGVYKVSATAGTKTRVLAAPPTTDGQLPYHGYIFSPMYLDGKYYAPYSGTFISGGFADTDPSGEYAGAVLAWSPDGAGGYTKHAGGLRSPNGGGLGPNGIMMFTENQGSWNPSCALNIIKPNRFYGSHQNTSKGFADNWAGLANKAGTLPYQPPIAWLLQAQSVGQQYGTAASTSQPLYMDHGPYAGDVIMGDNTLEGMSRVALDPVNGATGVNANYNGSVHWFTNLPGNGTNTPAPNRFAMDPGSDVIYVGTLAIIGQSGGAWPSGATQPFYKISLDAAAIKASFEILSVKSRSGGVEIAFSQPVSTASAVAGSFALKQWDLVRQEGYGAGNNTSTHAFHQQRPGFRRRLPGVPGHRQQRQTRPRAVHHRRRRPLAHRQCDPGLQPGLVDAQLPVHRDLRSHGPNRGSRLGQFHQRSRDAYHASGRGEAARGPQGRLYRGARRFERVPLGRAARIRRRRIHLPGPRTGAAYRASAAGRARLCPAGDVLISPGGAVQATAPNAESTP